MLIYNFKRVLQIININKNRIYLNLHNIHITYYTKTIWEFLTR